MKWNYREKKKLHGILREKAALFCNDEGWTSRWGDYVDRIGCKRILRGKTGWKNENTGEVFASSRMLRVRGFVQIADPSAHNTHVARTEFPTLLGRRVLLVPEDLASAIVTLGEAPP